MASTTRSVLTLEKNLEIIGELKKGKSVRCVSRLYDVPNKSTVGDIWKDREKIEKHMTTGYCPSLAKKRCIVRNVNFEKLDQACHVWCLQHRSKGAPLSGPLLREKALQLFAKVYPEKKEDSVNFSYF